MFKRHPQSLKLVHFAPAVFTLGLFKLLILSVMWSHWFLIPIAFHVVLLFVDSSIKNKNIVIGMLSVITSYMQLLAYGFGFLKAFWKRIILKKDEFSDFNKNFYK